MRRSDAMLAWDDEDEPGGNVEKVVAHDLTPEEVESVLLDDRAAELSSRSSGRPMVSGVTFTGRRILVIYEVAATDPLVLRPVTAYSLDDD